MTEDITQQHHRIKFERKTINDQTYFISKQTQEILKFIEQKHKEKL